MRFVTLKMMTGAFLVAAAPSLGAQEREAVEAMARLRAETYGVRAEMEAAAARLHAERPRLLAGMEATAAMLRAEEPRLHAEMEAMAAALHAALPHAGTGKWSRSFDDEAPAPWLQADPADSLYRAAREALNGRDYQAAARLFRQIRERHPRSGYAPDSYYFEALALYRSGGSSRMENARGLLEEQRRAHPDAPTRTDAETLRVRIQSALAQRGDAESARALQQQATAECDPQTQDLRATALSALLQMDAERAVPLLQEVLRSRDACSVELRRRAVFLVAQKMGAETVDILLDLAHRNPDPDLEVREQAVFWLSQVRSEEALDALASILSARDTDPRMQEKAVFAVSQHRSERAMEILRGYAERGDAPRPLRENAIFWIGQSTRAGGPAYLRGLYARLDDRELKEKVIFGVAQSRSEADHAWLLERAKDTSEDVGLRKNALFWAAQGGRVPPADLRDIYGTVDNREVKEQVIFVLSQARGPEAVDALMDIATRERDPKLREAAVFWLGQSKDPRVGEFLLKLIRGEGAEPDR